MMVKNAKYLGVTFDESISFDCHIKNLIKRLSRSAGILEKVKTLAYLGFLFGGGGLKP